MGFFDLRFTVYGEGGRGERRKKRGLGRRIDTDIDIDSLNKYIP